MKVDRTIRVMDESTSVWDVIKETASRPEQEEAFYVVDISDLVWKHKQWKLKLPRVEPFYAVKCNDNTTVLEVLAALGTGFDCASKHEIQEVLDLGVDQSRIIYANPCKTNSFIKFAAKQGVNLMTFDNETELHKIKTLFPDAKMVLRIRINDESARCPLGIKFGVEPEKAPFLLKVAKDLGINVVGVSFHVGSGCEDVNAFRKAIESAHQVFGVAEQMGFHFSLLDIGGGFPGNKEATQMFDEMVTVINTSLDQYFPEGSGVRIIAEPGRYYVTSAFTLCVNIIAKRAVSEFNSELGVEKKAFMYYVNDGVYGSFNCLMYDHAEVTAIPLENFSSDQTYTTSIWGPTCDGLDRILEKCQMPLMDVGDWMIFPNMGAYTVAAASTFNGFQKPSISYVMAEPTALYLQQVFSPDSNPVVLKTGYHTAENPLYPEGGIVMEPIFSELSVMNV